MHPLSHSLFHLREPLRVPLLLAVLSGVIALTGCGSKEEAEAAAKASPTPAEIIAQQPKVHGPEIKSVEITKPLKQDWVAAGKATYEGKCLPCHKLTADRVVGPGWAGVTKRRQPIWIMNMITNVDVMLDNDAEAQKLLQSCDTRMTVEVLSIGQARDVLEFMRQNDGEK